MFEFENYSLGCSFLLILCELNSLACIQVDQIQLIDNFYLFLPFDFTFPIGIDISIAFTYIMIIERLHSTCRQGMCRV